MSGPSTQSSTSSLPGSGVDAHLVRHLAALRSFVHAHAGRAVLGRESSADVVQSVCRELLEHRSRMAGQGSEAFRRWLCVTAQRKILQRHRHWNRQRRHAKRETARTNGDAIYDGEAAGGRTPPSPSGAAFLTERVGRLERAVARLPASHREALVLARFHGMSYGEVARRMGRTEGSVRMLISRALAQLIVLVGQERRR